MNHGTPDTWAYAMPYSPRRRGRRFSFVATLSALVLTLGTAFAFAADIQTDAVLSANVLTPTEVAIGNNTFDIKVWATGNISSSQTGVATVVNKYNMATDGTITPDSTSTTTLNFTVGYNYSQCSTSSPANIQGCASNPFVVTATLAVATGTPDATAGTLTVSGTGSSGLTWDVTPDVGYVEVDAPASDTSPPTINCTVPDSTVWYGDNVQVTCTATDTSGLAVPSDASFTLSTNVSDGVANASAATGMKQVCDTLNNCATAGPYTFMVDREDPTATFSDCPSAAVILGSAVNVNWTATDNAGSGLFTAASGSVALDTSTVGAKTASSPAPSDNVGNTGAAASCPYSVIYDWTGFFQPVDNSGWNLAKAGQAIPVKFSLGGNQGLNVLKANHPKITQIACPSNGTPDPIEYYETATANNGLVYDAAANQYNYVWKTVKTWNGKCFSFELGLNDDTSHTFKVQFTK